MIATKVGLPNSCSQCGTPVTEDTWFAEHDDAARSGLGVCRVCAAKADTNLTPNLLQQVIGDIPDEGILVTGAAAPGANSVTNPVTVAPASAEIPDTKADDLTAVKGIGPSRAKELTQLGIVSFRALAMADAEHLAAIFGVNQDHVAGWQLQALEFDR